MTLPLLLAVSALAARAAISPVEAPPEPLLHAGIIELKPIFNQLVFIHTTGGIRVECPRLEHPDFACTWMKKTRLELAADWAQIDATARTAATGFTLTARDNWGGSWTLRVKRTLLADGLPIVARIPAEHQIARRMFSIFPSPDFLGYLVETAPGGRRSVLVLKDADALRDARQAEEARRAARRKRAADAAKISAPR